MGILDSDLGVRTSNIGNQQLVMAAGKSLPVIEVFGPTLQGEGRLVGIPCYFVRFGGCDYRCSWCDSLHAVLPEEVRENAEKLTPLQITARVESLGGHARWVILSGGNPAILELGSLINEFHSKDISVAIETQGSKPKSWFNEVDLLTLSPKPPSSGMVTDWTALRNIIEKRLALHNAAADSVHRPMMDIKIVIFNEDDLDYAGQFARTFPNIQRHPGVRCFLSQGTEVGYATRDDLLDCAASLWELTKHDPDLGDWSIGYQLHVAFWGHKRGV